MRTLTGMLIFDPFIDQDLFRSRRYSGQSSWKNVDVKTTQNTLLVDKVTF